MDTANTKRETDFTIKISGSQSLTSTIMRVHSCPLWTREQPPWQRSPRAQATRRGQGVDRNEEVSPAPLLVGEECLQAGRTVGAPSTVFCGWCSSKDFVQRNTRTAADPLNRAGVNHKNAVRRP